jgi:hypothetical protein
MKSAANVSQQVRRFSELPEKHLPTSEVSTFVDRPFSPYNGTRQQRMGVILES